MRKNLFVSLLCLSLFLLAGCGCHTDAAATPAKEISVVKTTTTTTTKTASVQETTDAAPEYQPEQVPLPPGRAQRESR